MGGVKVNRPLEINQDHLNWLQKMASEYGLFDEHKALRVVLDFAMQDAKQELVFTEVRCSHCSDTPNQD